MLDEVVQIIRKVVGNPTLNIGPETALIGPAQILDSFGLLELCLQLEDFASGKGFTFDWTSSISMSEKSSYFRSVETLVTELENQASK